PDRSQLLDPARPYVVSIDQRPLREWIDAVSPFVAQGSPQLVQERSLRQLRWIQFARGCLNLPQQKTVRVELAGRDGTDRVAMQLEVSDRCPVYGRWPRTRS